MIAALIYFIPGMPEKASAFFWGALGESWDIFGMASNLLESAINHNSSTVESISLAENIFVSYISLLLNAALDAIFMSCCVLLVKSFFVTFKKVKQSGKNTFVHVFSHSEWLLGIAGVGLSVLLKPMLNVDSKHLSTFIQGIVTIVILIFGIRKIFTAGKQVSTRRDFKEDLYRADREAFLLKLVLDVLMNAVNAIAAVNMITCLLEGPRILHTGGNVLILIGWFFFSFLVSCVCSMFA